MSTRQEVAPESAGIRLSQPSDWQRDRIRDALRAYHQYERDPDTGRGITWADVREAILESTGAAIGISPQRGAERLRQFVFGVKKAGKDGLHFPLPQPFEAVSAFATDPDNGLLSPDELEEPHSGPLPVLRLLEHFQDRCDLTCTIDLSALAGTYLGYIDRPDHNAQHHLILEYRGEELLHVTEAIEVSHPSDARVPGLNGGNLDVAAISRTGWAIVTPEDNMIIFLKSAATGRNVTYYSVSDVGTWQRTRQDNDPLYFLKQELGLEDIMAPHEVLQNLSPELNWFVYAQHSS